MELLVEQYPIWTFLFLSYAMSWSVWFTIPLFAGGQWALLKILVCIGMGPGLAAVLLDRIRGNAGPLDRVWGLRFAMICCMIAATDVSSLMTGDGRTADDFAVARAPGVSASGLAGSALSAAVCAFIFASAAGSRSHSLNSIVRWRTKPRWWITALLLPAALLILSLAFAHATGEHPDPVTAGLPLLTWITFSVRSILFTLLAVAVGEEPGWRGFLLPELQKRFSPLLSSLLLGVVWGLWHFPLFLNGAYPGGPEMIFEYLFLGPLIAILFTLLYNRTAGNLLLMLVLHTAINNSQRVLPTGSMFPVLLTVLIVTLVFTERMWRRRGVAAD